MQRRGVIKCFDRLEVLGYIERKRKKDAKKTDTNHYILRESLQSPFKGKDPDTELLVARESNSLMQKRIVSHRTQMHVRQDTSESVPQDTLYVPSKNEPI